jgi:hypothetical protein
VLLIECEALALQMAALDEAAGLLPEVHCDRIRAACGVLDVTLTELRQRVDPGQGPVNARRAPVPVVIAMLLGADAMVVAIASLDLWAGQLAGPEHRRRVRHAVRALDDQVRGIRRRIHQAAGR